ncbi:MAG TPA: translation initiation factor IF-2 [Hyphomicrobiaceae bacterium]|nr:translation initiation factor IF-2 [Hyphomicrobiaceae bacterium]
MSETKETDKTGAGAPRRAAGPRRADSSSHVQQSFSHGRKNTVVVEHKTRRKIAVPGTADKPAARPGESPAKAAGAGAKPQARGPAGQPAARGLSTGEVDKRAQALLAERKRAEEERARLEAEAEQRRLEEEALAAQRKAEDEERQRQAAEEARARGVEPPTAPVAEPAAKAAAPAQAATPAPAARDQRDARAPAAPGRGPAPQAGAAPAARAPETPGAPKPGVVVPLRRGRPEAEVEDDDARAKRKGGVPVKPARSPVKGPEERRASGRLTVERLLNDEQRERSLASLRRKRERDQRRALGIQQSREKIMREVIIPEVITIQELANRMTEKAVDVIRLLMKQGAMHKINDVIDADTAELIVTEFGHTPKRVSEADVEEGFIGAKDVDENLEQRAPVVTIMGHVDHGKTSLLDAIRNANVAGGEAGGITQHIGAYQVTAPDGQKITFIDTPGHEAFTAMRARGAKVTDIVILVVAADDGVMPQTVEAINHAKAAGVPMIVAINKIDKPNADPKRVATELLQHEVVVESLSGETQDIQVSALKGTNLDKLLEAISLQAEILELKANPQRSAEGFVIEAKLERGRGPVGTLLVQRGTLKVGDIIVAGASWGRVRALLDDKGKNVVSAGPSVPVEVLGFDSAPEAGDQFAVVESEARAREITDYRIRKRREALGSAGTSRTLEQMMQQLKEAGRKEFPLVIKGDVQGSVEAIMGALAKLGNEEVSARIIHSGVGQITESDISLAAASKAIILGFNVRANVQAKQAADSQGIEIRYYSIIYDLVDEVKAAMSGLLAPTKKEVFLGYATIKQVFNISKQGKVAGCLVTEGKVERGAKVRLLREKTVIHEGTLAILKRFKDDVREVPAGQECGMAFANYQDIREGDEIECFQVETIARSL